MTPSERRAVIARRLAEARRSAGLTGKQVCLSIKRGRSTLQEWESGNTVPGADDLLALANLYNMSTDWLVGRDVEEGFFGLCDDRIRKLIRDATDPKAVYEYLPRLVVQISETVVAVPTATQMVRILDDAYQKLVDLERHRGRE